MAHLSAVQLLATDELDDVVICAMMIPPVFLCNGLHVKMPTVVVHASNPSAGGAEI